MTMPPPATDGPQTSAAVAAHAEGDFARPGEALPKPHGIIALFTRHRTLANLLLVVLLLAGAVTLPKMRAQFFPDSVEETVTVSVVWEGAGAEEIDRAIVQVLEPSLIAVEGVSESESRSIEGAARITLTFEDGWDMSRAVSEVEQAVNTAGDLPEASEEPEIKRGAWRDTVTDVVITGPLSPEQIGRLADELVTRLYAEGVTRTTIQGFLAPQTVVDLPTVQMMRHNVTLTEIAAVIGAEAATSPAGDVANGAQRVRVGEERREARTISELVLREEEDGSLLRVGDVARVRVEGGNRERAYYVGDNPAISINVGRSAEGDAIALQHKVEDIVAQMRPTLPAATSMDLIRSRSEAIQARLDLLMRNGTQGLVLVVVLLFLFLNARTAFWVAMGIPTAIAAALFAMYLAGMTLNMISIFALILTLGIVVDDAIVVGEHADFRARALGEHPVLAAEQGARRMLAPVMASSLTSIIAFGGLTMMGGPMGRMVSDIPWTVIAVLSASLVECFLILPNHMAHALAHTAKERWYDWPSRKVNAGLDWFRLQIMRPFVRMVLVARYTVLAGAISLMLAAVALVVGGAVQWRFFSPPEQSMVSAAFSMLAGAKREDTLAQMRALQAAAEQVGAGYEQEYGTNPVTYVVAQIGGAVGRSLASADGKDADLLGAITIELIDQDYRSYSSADFLARFEAAAEKHPLIEELSFRSFYSGPSSDGISVKFADAESRVLKDAAEDLKLALAAFPEVSALEDNLAYDKEELILDLTPQGAALGFDIDMLARELRARLNGIEAATFPDGTREAAIRVEMPEEELTADFLERMQMRTPAGAWVPLSDIVSARTSIGFSTIRREDGVRSVEVTGNISEDNAERANEIERQMTQVILPRIAEEYGVSWSLGGAAEREREFMGDAMLGLTLVLIGIYICLAWIFSSWTRPLVVMSVIPFGLIGAFWGHWHWGVPLSMFSIVGLIGMTGIIINDAIVLISTIDEYATRRGLRPAIVDAVADRLRPVMLTTLTTVLGLGPLLYERSSSALFLKPTVITLVYGLGFGMVIVLIVVPAALAVGEDFGRALRALRRGLRAGHGAGRRLRTVLGAATAIVALAFAATLGRALWAGTGTMSALGLFVGIALVVTLAAGALAPRLLRGAGRAAAE
ncbi:efflux RND transporter permease subunit [Rhodobacter lacus]|uniref:Efflux RND transporter permease subunit n=1 Tax=Rhodobacter lacus TaxID=1641972 RepID=A0ABW5A5A4_9RHOB